MKVVITDSSNFGVKISTLLELQLTEVTKHFRVAC